MRPRPDHARFDPVHHEDEVPPARPITPPPVTSAPVLMDEPPFAPPERPMFSRVPEPEPEPVEYAAPVAEPVSAVPEPEPVIADSEPPASEYPAPSEPIEPVEPVAEPAAVEEAPQPVPFADEQIAAAAPFDASPASIAADVPDAVAESQPLAAAGADDLTTMKGIGPRLADRLNAIGVTSFAQIAALSPDDAEALDAKLGDFQGRIHRDRWIEQAVFLAVGDIAGFDLPEDRDYATVAGLALAVLKRLPNEGDAFVEQGWRFE
ncbi:MAG: hypothetical protein EOP59_01555, partial [Sphingomonadales bacterium]